MKTKLNDPFIGSYIFSFFVCNWKESLVLVFGNKKLEERIGDFVAEMAVSTNSLADFSVSLFFIYLLPFTFACFYVFAMPWISIWITKKVSKSEVAKHEAAVDMELKQAIKQRYLNEEKLLNDPNKPFLEEAIREKTKQKRLQTETLQSSAEKAKNEAEKAKDEAGKAKAEAEKATMDNQMSKADKDVKQAKAKTEKEKQAAQSVIEKNKVKVSAAETKAMLQANAYFAAFNFVQLLSKSLAQDNISLTVESLTEIIATVFGYDNFNDLLGDKSFNNDELQSLKYILVDSKALGSRLEEILTNDHIDPSVCSSDHIFDHIELMFENLPYTYRDAEAIAELVFLFCSENVYDFTESEEFCGAQASTNTTIDQAELYDYKHNLTDDALVLDMYGHASGSDRKESDISGQGVDFHVKATLAVKWGRYALAEKPEYEISASPESFDDDYIEESVIAESD